MATTICFSKGTQLRPECKHDFLDAHVSEWRERSVHQRCGLRDFQSSQHAITRDHRLPGSHKYGVFMHYMRSFTIMDFEETPIIKGSPATGLKCKREKIGFKAFYSEDTECLVERRYSTALNIFPIHSPSGHYVLLSLIDAGEHEYGVWSHSPTNDITSYNRWKPWKRYGIYPAAIYSGVSVFQLQICSFIESWESDWNNTLTRINQMVSVKVRSSRIHSLAKRQKS